MMQNNITVHKAKTIQELQSILKNISDIRPVAGCTAFLNNQTEDITKLPQNILDLSFLPDFQGIFKTERYFEFSAGVTLNEILNRGRKNIPSVLYDAIEKIGNNAIRSLATIAGNIAEANPLSGAFLPLLALDAKLEIRTATDVEWISFAKYIDNINSKKYTTPFIIHRIRIPNESWSKNVYTRLGPSGFIGTDSASFLLLLSFQKNIISDIKLFFASDKLIKSKEFDNLLLGHYLPLTSDEIPKIIEKAKDIFKNADFSSDFYRVCFFNLLEDNLYSLT